MDNSLIRVQNLCKSFNNDGVKNNVLNNINIKINEGDFTIIMGSSGSGKSTLLYTLSGMDDITTGNVYYKNNDISSLDEKQLINLRKKDFGFIFQQMHLISNLTNFENIVIHGYLTKEFPEETINAKARQLAVDMGIHKILNYLPSQVSGGEQQRTAVARALISNPEIVFADEPTGSLNKQSGIEVLNILTDINRKKQSVLMVTHDIRASIRGNRILYLEDGKICGEMEMTPYTDKEADIREKQVIAWLSSRGW